jgi:hypothetical protein
VLVVSRGMTSMKLYEGEKLIEEVSFW